MRLAMLVEQYRLVLTHLLDAERSIRTPRSRPDNSSPLVFVFIPNLFYGERLANDRANMV